VFPAPPNSLITSSYLLLPRHQASEDIPIAEAGALGSIMVVAFVAVAAAKGDYGVAPPPGLDAFSRRRAMVRALLSAGTTWGVGVGATLVCDALLLRCHAVSPTAFLSATSAVAAAAGAAGAGAGVAGHGAPPIAEVLVSALVTLCSWRGIHAGLRGILL
jgi:hypothetical protein